MANALLLYRVLKMISDCMLVFVGLLLAPSSLTVRVHVSRCIGVEMLILVFLLTEILIIALLQKHFPLVGHSAHHNPVGGYTSL